MSSFFFRKFQVVKSVYKCDISKFNTARKMRDERPTLILLDFAGFSRCGFNGHFKRKKCSLNLGLEVLDFETSTLLGATHPTCQFWMVMMVIWHRFPVSTELF